MPGSGFLETHEWLKKTNKNVKMDEFQCLDFMLLASGCKIFIPNKYVRILNHSLCLIMITAYAVIFYYNYMETKEKGGYTVLYTFSHYCHEVAGLLFMIVMNCNRILFQDRISTLMRAMDDKQRRSLSQLSFWCMIAVWVTVGQDFISTTIHLSIGHLWDEKWHIVTDFIDSYNLLNNWFLGGCFVYAFCVKMIRFSEENYFTRINEEIDLQLSSSNSHHESALELAYERRRFMTAKHQMLECFSLIPLLWTVFTFIYSITMFVELIEKYDLWLDRIWRVLPLVQQITALSYVVYLCDSCTRYTRQQINALILTMMNNRSYHDFRVFVDELKEGSDKDFTVFDTFPINRSFILAYVSSLISFTALFLEVIYSYFRREVSDITFCNCTSARVSYAEGMNQTG